MRYIPVKNSNMSVSEIALGCMRIGDMSEKDVTKLVNTALENGVNFFDNADIYCGGKSEQIFSKAIKQIDREKIYIQSKCGIRKGFFDFSKDYILQSVDGILKRLDTDYIDCLLLHRPDALVEPTEVAVAFNILKENGKVRYFGVSNQKPMQIELLQKSLKDKLVFNQLQLSVTNCNMISNGINVNMSNSSSVDRDGSVLDYCRLNDITIQSWSPLQYGFFEGVFVGSEKYPELNKKLSEIAEKYSSTPTAVAVSWISRHPAKIQTVIGTTNVNRIQSICDSTKFSLTREEWYDIYRSVGNILP